MTPLTPGQRLGGDKYEIVRPIGRGGFGAVYLAVQHPVRRQVAVKIIVPERADDPNLARRFFREAKVISRLRHGSTVTLHDYGVEGGRLYMVMEYIDGIELSRLIRTEGPLAPGRVASLAIQAAGALAEAHRLNLVHRDIKPSNMMVTPGALGDEHLKLLDFGIAKLLDAADETQATRTGVVIGTPSYMAPEQIVGRGIGPWSDQYALGVVMFHMLAGRKPYAAPSSVEVLDAHRHAPIPWLPAALGVPEGLETIVRRAMSKRALDRFPDMASMARALRALALDVPDDTRAAPPLQEAPTMQGGAPPADEPLWVTTGATSLEMRGSLADRSLRRRGARTHGLLALLLTGAAGAGLVAALLVGEPAVAPAAAPDAATRIRVGTGPAPDAAAPDAAPPDAALPDAASPDAASPDAAPRPATPRRRRPPRRAAPVPAPAPPPPVRDVIVQPPAPVDPPPASPPQKTPRERFRERRL